MPHREVGLHARAAQVEIAVFEPHVFIDVVIGGHDERRRLGAREHLELRDRHFDRTGSEFGIFRAAGTALRAPAYAHDELVAQRFRYFERRGVGRIERDLRDPIAVAQIDEDQSAVIAAAVHPAGELDRPIDVVRAERSTGNAREFRMGHVRPP